MGRKKKDVKTKKEIVIEASTESIEFEMEDITKEGAFDPRRDISISSVNSYNSKKPRLLNPSELVKFKKLADEDLKIFKKHPKLEKQEENILNELDCVTPIDKNLGMRSELMKHQLYGIGWMINRENSEHRGGILADEMGLGKTIQVLGLMLAGEKSDINMAVLPSVALYQWVSQIELHAPSLFNVIFHYGAKKEELNIDKDKHTLILTTYGTLQRAVRGKGYLSKLKYKRIILDEAHLIKDCKTATAQAIYGLDAEYRWSLTGTPLQNRATDLLSLVRFLRIDPHSYYFCKKCDCKSFFWLRYNEKDVERRNGFCVCGHFSASHFSWWNRRISTPMKLFGQTVKNKEICEKLAKITGKIILRRTKLGLEKELGLPSKICIVKRCFFNPQEKEFYTSLYSETQMKFKSYAVNGQINNNYVHIFELLTKMRQAVNHPFLTYKKNLVSYPICGFCNDEANDPIKSKCGHYFCRGEAEIFLEKSKDCPVCKVKLTLNLFSEEVHTPNPEIISVNDWMSSTKIETLVEMLNSFKSDCRVVKNIVFSQFVSFLEILRWRLERAGIRCVKIYGMMNAGQRKAAIDAFNTDATTTVFLISLKAGGVALNLTEAENVFIMDLWWNPAIEEQAMDRIHRIGQYRPIRIYRIIVQDSIESRILELQKKKKALFESTIDNDTAALQRLTDEDMLFLFN